MSNDNRQDVDIPLIDEHESASVPDGQPNMQEFYDETPASVPDIQPEEKVTSKEESEPKPETEVDSEELTLKDKAIEFLKGNGIYWLVGSSLVAVLGGSLLFYTPPGSNSSFKSDGAGSTEFTFDDMQAPAEQTTTTVQAPAVKTPTAAASATVSEALEPVQRMSGDTDTRVPVLPRYQVDPDMYMTKEEVKQLFVEEMNKALMDDRKAFIDFKQSVTEQVSGVTQSFYDVKQTVYKIQKDLEAAASNGDLKVVLNTVNKVSQTLDKQEAKLDKQYDNLNDRLKKIESMPINAKPVKGTVAKSENKPAIRYRIASAMRSKAWIRNQDGKLVFLEVGDRLKGYGQILKIIPDGGGRIFTVSGEVELIRE